MGRLLVILMLAVAGLRPGMAETHREAPGTHRAASMACCEPTPPPPSTCCESETAEPSGESAAAFCPMTGGECECFDRPADAPDPLPQAPKPLSGITLVPAPVSIETTPTPAAPSVCSARPHLSLLGLTRLHSQNETQALLGVWQT